MSSRRRGARRRSEPTPARTQPGAAPTPQGRILRPLPQWRWRTFPVFFALSFGLFFGIYIGSAAQAAGSDGNSTPSIIAFALSAILFGFALSRIAVRFVLARAHRRRTAAERS